MGDYANPANTGLGSDKRACSQVIKQVLDVLTYPQLRFDIPPLPSTRAWEEVNEGISFEHDCAMFRMRMFSRLKEAGWLLHHNDHGLTVEREK